MPSPYDRRETRRMAARRTPDLRRHELSQTGDSLRRCGAAVLRSGGQNRQFSGGCYSAAVDRRAGVSAGGGPLPARRVAHRHRAGSRACPPDSRLSGEMAASTDVAPTGARERIHGDGRVGRCGIRRHHAVPSDLHRLRLPYAWASRRTSRCSAARLASSGDRRLITAGRASIRIWRPASSR